MVSIVEELERRKLARERDRVSSMHLRELEASLELMDHTAALKDLDLDGEIERLGALGTEDAKTQRASLRAARALQSCLRGDPEAGFAEWAEVVLDVPRVAHTYLIRARWLMLSDPAAALADYDRAAAAEPRNAAAYWRRADCHLAMGDQDRALANYRRAVALDPSLFDAFHSIAKILAARGEHAEAVQAYDRAIALAPRYVDFYLGHAQSLERLDDDEGAALDYTRILELDPSRNDARFYRVMCEHRAGHLERAVEDMIRFVELEAEDHHNQRILGKMHLEAGHHALAVGSLTRALALLPDDPMTLAHRARAHAELGEHALAFADLDLAVTVKPDDADLHVAHARAADAIGRHDVALVSASRAIAIAPDNVLAHVLRALYRERTATGDEAHPLIMADLDRAVELAPGNAGVLRQRADYCLTRGSFTAAMADFERILAILPQAAQVYYCRGICKSHLPDELYDLDEDYDEEPEETRERCLSAVADFEQAIALGFADEDIYGELWNTYCQMEGEDAAQLTTLDRGIAAAPTSAMLYQYRSGHRLSHGDLAGAQADRLRATELGYRIVGLDGQKQCLPPLTELPYTQPRASEATSPPTSEATSEATSPLKSEVTSEVTPAAPSPG